MSWRVQSEYSAHDHGIMIADRVRVESYRRALERAVKPGDVVVDIGTGTGLLALFACQFGARKVYAIETEEIIELAREIAQKNGYANQIEFIRDHSTNVMLAEQADVIVSDVHGALPIFGRGLESLADARRRFLKEGGILIPQRDRLWVAAVELPDKDYGQVAVWSDGRWGVDLSPGIRFGVDCPFSSAIESAQLRTEPVCFASLEHAAAESATVGGIVQLSAAHDGIANGYAIWFDAELTDGVWLTSAPGAAIAVYPRRFAPWTHPVQLHAGDVITADLRFVCVNDDYVWQWNTSIRTAQNELLEQFRQSSFNSMFITSEPLARRRPTFHPRLDEHGQAALAILQLMDAKLTLQEIAQEVLHRYSGVFADASAALRAVADLSEAYSH